MCFVLRCSGPSPIVWPQNFRVAAAEVALCVQAPVTTEQLPKEVSARFDQDDFSQEQEKADTTITEELPTTSPNKSAPIFSEQASDLNPRKAPGALPQHASGAPSEKASTPSPPAKPALSTTWVGRTPTKSVQPLTSRSLESDAVTDAEPAPKLKDNKEAETVISGGEQEGDSWRLAAHHTASSSSSSTGMSSTGEGSTAASGDCGDAEQQEAADAAETFSLQPTDPQDTVAVEELPLKPAKEEQSANNRPLQPREIVQETAAGSGCAEQQEAAEAADTFPLQPIKQQGT